LGVSATNDNAIGFYQHLGFVDLTAAGPTRWMGLSLT
jgi:ribosomal protein S18 acetylase RimI-like enzyme